ncbi:hypothetical protein Back2_17900 [Nocardioides baekrokdamisoli]|uniref:Uncharacterized protein n=1 Tax=Nocardioides baekrokdamisoli TaxID=1804624 RepID=A0A3G9IYJ0_9ACTN|nr:hypothetical protein [Nocardioides baekrokdamisoli]BBH17503.1 hypothetical protein Back2_17900 [Nocardioides baekrokdamisoli]
MGTEKDQVAGAPGSLLSSIRDRRAKAKEELFIDYPVPGYEPKIFVRYAPLDQPTIATGYKVIENKKKDQDAVMRVHATFLVNACIGIYELDDDGDPISIDPEDRSPDPADWVKFDHRLAEILGDDVTRAADIVRALYIKDGDVLATSNKLSEFSGYTGEQLDEDYEGN